MKVLVLNSGSSSIKYQVFAMPEGAVLAKGVLERIGEEGAMLTHKVYKNGEEQKTTVEEEIRTHNDGIKLILTYLELKEHGVVESIQEVEAVGHRVVHGGEGFTGSVRVTDEVIKTIEEYSDLAPLHNPPNLTGIKATTEILGNIPQVACFDTAFHQSIPKHAYLYAIPYDLYETHKIRRYGFHGTSHKYVAQEAAKLLGKKPEEANVITAHLGNGCSITAVKNGKSIDTSMGLTPLEGLVMGTRSGDIDPAIIYHLVSKLNMTAEEINTMLNKKSGLLGISGVSNDMRNLVELHEKGEARATLALEIFAYRIRKYIGAYMAVLNELDAIVFTGGIGENNAINRRMVVEGLSFWGIEIDNDKNDTLPRSGGEISKTSSKVKILVVPTDEEKAIAIDTFELCK